MVGGDGIYDNPHIVTGGNAPGSKDQGMAYTGDGIYDNPEAIMQDDPLYDNKEGVMTKAEDKLGHFRRQPEFDRSIYGQSPRAARKGEAGGGAGDQVGAGVCCFVLVVGSYTQTACCIHVVTQWSQCTRAHTHMHTHHHHHHTNTSAYSAETHTSIYEHPQQAEAMSASPTCTDEDCLEVRPYLTPVPLCPCSAAGPQGALAAHPPELVPWQGGED